MRESRRRWRRKESGAVCIVDLCDDSKPVKCRLINISNGGARLHGFIDTSKLPNQMKLFLCDRRIMERDCRVVWRGSREIGVEFIASPRQLSLDRVAFLTLLIREKHDTERSSPPQAA